MEASAEPSRKKLITCMFCTVLDTSDTYPTSALFPLKLLSNIRLQFWLRQKVRLVITGIRSAGMTGIRYISSCFTDYVSRTNFYYNLAYIHDSTASHFPYKVLFKFPIYSLAFWQFQKQVWQDYFKINILIYFTMLQFLFSIVVFNSAFPCSSVNVFDYFISGKNSF